MRKSTICFLAVLRFFQLFMIVFGILILSKAIQQATLWSIGVGAAFLVIAGALMWLMEEMIKDFKRWDPPPPGEQP
jgi:multisubunit Na+/H+ antiporter MnhB subunit